MTYRSEEEIVAENAATDRERSAQNEEWWAKQYPGDSDHHRAQRDRFTSNAADIRRGKR